MTIRELVRRHVIESGMTEREAALMLEAFARATKDFDWEGLAPKLSPQQIARIDGAALGWCMRHRQTEGYEDAKFDSPKTVRDGKMLATGETV